MATNSIGSAALILSTNFGGMIQGLNQAGDSIGSWVNMALDKVFLLSNGMQGALTAIGFPPTFAKSLSDVSESIDKASKKSRVLGVSTATMIGLTHASALAGVQTDDLSKGMQKLARNLASARSGSSEAVSAFAEVGIAQEDLRNLSLEDTFLRTAQAISEIQDPASRIRIAMELFGRGGAALLPLFESGSRGISNMANEARRLGTANITDEQALAIEEMNDNWTRVGMSIKGVWTQLLIGLTPVLSDIAKSLVEIWVSFQPIVMTAAQFIQAGWEIVKSAIGSIVSAIQEIPDWLSNALIGVGVFIAGFMAFQQIVSIIGLVKAAFIALKAVMLANPIFLIATVITAIISAFVDWEAVIKDIGENWESIKGAFLIGLSLLVDGFDLLLAAVQKVLDIMSLGGLLGDWSSGIRSFRSDVQATSQDLAQAGLALNRLRNPPSSNTPPIISAEEQERLNRLGGMQNGQVPEWMRAGFQMQQQANELFTRDGAERAKAIADLNKSLEESFQNFGMSQDEQRLARIRQLGASAEELQRLQSQMDRNLGQQLEADADPLTKFREEMDRINRAFESGNLSFRAFTTLRDRALDGAERALAIPEVRFSGAVLAGSREALDAQVRHNFQDNNLSAEERQARILERNNELQAESNELFRRLIANDFGFGDFEEV